jgi:hypothetical protein
MTSAGCQRVRVFFGTEHGNLDAGIEFEECLWIGREWTMLVKIVGKHEWRFVGNNWFNCIESFKR